MSAASAVQRVSGQEAGPLFSHITPLPPRTELRRAITAAWRSPEPERVPALVEAARLSPELSERSRARALGITRGLRKRKSALGKAGLVQGLLQEFSLSSQEGVALMCLAEALLRIPDTATRDALIRDKIRDGHWHEHLGKAPSLFVNAAAWGLMLTGKLVSTHSEAGMSAALGRLVAKGGEPLIRKGVDLAMRMMGEQFVTGQTIQEALRNARPMEERGFRYSYDMLGEAAMTATDARRYLSDYDNAIHAIGKAARGLGVYEGPGISIKLSALHPRYARAQVERVMNELYPRLLELAKLAKHYDIGLNIDAEEADRLELSLDLLERLCFEPELQGWQGLGFVIQAYQKRCPEVVDYLIDLARRSTRRLMIRLVKGAYWDTEIKRAQVEGLDGYPVYTRKVYTDVCYIACARKLLAAPHHIYPQFATHNALTLATIYELAGPASYYPGQYEFQCLHGMGEALYDQVVGAANGKQSRPCRIYAPVGTHETLLAYLVRRLLENGANTSFVNRVADPSVAIEVLVEDPVRSIETMAGEEGRMGVPHPAIPLPRVLYGEGRVNSRGLDLANDDVLTRLVEQLQREASKPLRAGPMLAVQESTGKSEANGFMAVVNPADCTDVVGHVRHATAVEAGEAVEVAYQYAPVWAAVPAQRRAKILLRAADFMEADMERLLGVLVREAGKTYANAVAEVREAVDFLRYYSAQVEATFDNHTHKPLGVVTCISPWNFPLAIFTGQIVAALAAGNVVLAKPAEQTTLIAAEGVRLLWKAGVPCEALQLVPGKGGEVGPLLTDDERVQGVMFTGSTEVARQLQRILARRVGPQGRPIPLVAETGGQNAMIVDSSALPEQVVRDVVLSAFDSAGQRCSALRVLCVQEEVADQVVAMLKGAMEELRLGNPIALHTDVGPVIDARARDAINQHIDSMAARGHKVSQLCWGGEGERRTVLQQGIYVAPTLIEIQTIGELKREVFGPVLHLLRYKRENLDALLEQVKATGYGLTMGLHTRIDETIRQVSSQAHVGNLYVNRNMVGAVVGVQPFGGEGLSGTGPKAGGPLYLYRLLAERPADALKQPYGALVSETLAPLASVAAVDALVAWQAWCDTQPGLSFVDKHAFFGLSAHTLNGPTGERNVYQIHHRQAVLCIAQTESALLDQLAALLSVGSRAVWNGKSSVAEALYHRLPATVQSCVELSPDWSGEAFDAVLHQGDVSDLQAWQQALADREGAIVPLIATGMAAGPIPLERLVLERAISIDTTAAGGNASLMTLS
ncbi:trifunctional transcriptional regulator/proline dehydrogenase/L-glutamate gamma-semialdehyde dehydrogenase [Achromobacter sp. F4_2707]|uniref:trifunctional transcriptional regulator/proline dehydrogenase/L-glutamate gamma-semialdehyde dehydrogenase n=1 Tax=Achromobacter sp. F4_2707 TaxID=3114286 RepID=UPI0039C5F7D3